MVFLSSLQTLMTAQVKTLCVDVPTIDSWDSEFIAFAICLAMAVIGIIYIVLGAFCFQTILDNQLNGIRRKKQVQLQANQLNKHKEEIEQLLKDTDRKMQNL